MRPLRLSIRPGTWRKFSQRKFDANFKKISRKIFERDEYVCQFCGFQAKQHQEIINLDGDYNNNALSNLATACCFCSQCFFLETVGKDDISGGVLIYLPEISQGELNGFCHVIFCAIANATNYREDAQTAYRNLKLRSQIIENELGEGMNNPTLLAQMLIDTPNQQQFGKKITSEILHPLRLLPSHSKFSKQIDDWAQNAVDELEQ